MSSLGDYLAKYSIGKENKKSKKRKHRGEYELANHEVDSASLYEDEDAKIVVEKKKKAKSGWRVAGTEETVEVEPKILEDGTFAGLQTREEAEKSRKLKDEKLRREQKELENAHKTAPNETVYRDLTGRKLNADSEELKAPISAEERAKKDKIEKRKELEKINRSETEVVRKLEELAKLDKVEHEGLNVYENDEKVNEVEKRETKRDDPALMFDKKLRRDFSKGGSRKYVSITGRKLYKNGFPANRFNIRPGWRWDGVDRSNGFEKRWFEKQAEIKDGKQMKYAQE